MSWNLYDDFMYLTVPLITPSRSCFPLVSQVLIESNPLASSLDGASSELEVLTVPAMPALP